MRFTAQLQAGLKNLSFGNGFGGQRDGFGIFDGVGQRRFTIDMLAGFDGFDGDVFVLMRCRGNEHAVNVFIGENLFVIRDLLGFRRSIAGALEECGIALANRHHIGSF